MNPPEIHTFPYRGAPIRAHLSTSDVLSILASEGQPIPLIPAGCNTNSELFTLRTGERALCVIQRGFSPVASDDEREVNGAILLVLADSAWAAPDADRILDAVYEFMLPV